MNYQAALISLRVRFHLESEVSPTIYLTAQRETVTFIDVVRYDEHMDVEAYFRSQCDYWPDDEERVTIESVTLVPISIPTSFLAKFIKSQENDES